MDVVHIVGASGKSGGALCRALLAEGRTVVPVVRSAERWATLGIPLTPRLADLEAPSTLRSALADASIVVSCAHARHAAAILAATGASTRSVFLGSTRRFTRWPDEHGLGVIAGEAAVLASGRSAAILHPTMIYGADGEDDVQRLEGLLRRLPVIPLPGGGRNLVQPIHQSDITRCIVSASSIEWERPQAIVIAGPSPVSYIEFTRAIARHARLPAPRIVGVPAWAMMAAAPLTRLVPGLPSVHAAEIRRLLEDKAFPIDRMKAILGVLPISLDDGLSQTFSQGRP